MKRRLFALLLATGLAACSAPRAEPAYPTRPGLFATSALPLDAEQLAWAARFALVETGDLGEPADPDVAELRRRGVGVLLYEWMPAGYHYTDGGPDAPFMRWVYADRDNLTLNPDGPFPHCTAAGYDWCEDYYYDLALPELRERRAAYIAENLAAAEAAGVFFDWGPGVFIEEDAYASMRETFAARHPGGDYLAAVGEFYAGLRAALPEARLIVSNQGFRNAERVLPHVDLDMTESYGTGEEYLGRRLYLEGRGWTEVPSTIYYPVSEDYRSGSLRDTLYWLYELDRLADRWAGPRFRGFVYMNYAAPEFEAVGALADGTPVYAPRPPRNAVFFGYALPLLKGWTGYTETPWDHAYERGFDLYFADLGAPLEEDYLEIASGSGSVYLRCYENGIAVVGEGERAGRLELDAPCIREGRVFDLYAENWLEAAPGRLEVAVEATTDEVTGRAAPWGRVFVYAR
ncbi:hypothetical protein [Oceanithermus sp.]